jgi:hypothetical protein
MKRYHLLRFEGPRPSPTGRYVYTSDVLWFLHDLQQDQRPDVVQAKIRLMKEHLKRT